MFINKKVFINSTEWWIEHKLGIPAVPAQRLCKVIFTLCSRTRAFLRDFYIVIRQNFCFLLKIRVRFMWQVGKAKEKQVTGKRTNETAIM